jgi:drug/metabolite transporter (DMT)-like permease
VGTVVVLPFAGSAVAELARASAPAVAAVVYLGVFPTAVGFALWAYALARLNAGVVASTTLSVPAIVVVMSGLLLGELPSLVALLGGALCLLGVAVSRRRPRAAG